MSLRVFTIRASFQLPEDESLEDRLRAIGCGDAAVRVEQGRATLIYRREASCFSEAVEAVLGIRRGADGAVTAHAGPGRLSGILSSSEGGVPFRERVVLAGADVQG